MIFDGQPAIVGHRGFGAGQPGGYRENSVESFLAAVRQGLPWVELDARRSSDGELVLWHDPVTPDGQLIVTQTAAELAAGGIVRLADVLAVLPAGVGVNIDVKTTIEDATKPAAQRTHALIATALHRYRGTRSFLVSSFDPSVPMYLKDRNALTGGVALGLRLGRGQPWARCGLPAHRRPAGGAWRTSAGRPQRQADTRVCARGRAAGHDVVAGSG